MSCLTEDILLMEKPWHPLAYEAPQATRLSRGAKTDFSAFQASNNASR